MISINTHLYYNGSTSDCPDYRGVRVSTIAGLTVIPNYLESMFEPAIRPQALFVTLVHSAYIM